MLISSETHTVIERKEREGQPGHKSHTREQALVPTSIVQCAPKVCPDCGKPLNGGSSKE